MELSSLTAKQKRALDWDRACKETQDQTLRLKFETALSSYRRLLAQCWEKNTITTDDEQQMANLERILEEYDGASRCFPISGKVTSSRPLGEGGSR